jgi:hypothetical protein
MDLLDNVLSVLNSNLPSFEIFLKEYEFVDLEEERSAIIESMSNMR